LGTLSTLGDLVNVRFGEWEDLQIYHQRDLFLFSVRHEGLVAARRDLYPDALFENPPFAETMAQTEPVEASIEAFLRA
jgi:hypothetical protein